MFVDLKKDSEKIPKQVTSPKMYSMLSENIILYRLPCSVAQTPSFNWQMMLHNHFSMQ